MRVNLVEQKILADKCSLRSPSNIAEIGTLLREVCLDRLACAMEIKIVAGPAPFFQFAVLIEEADASALKDNLNISVGLGTQFRRRAIVRPRRNACRGRCRRITGDFHHAGWKQQQGCDCGQSDGKFLHGVLEEIDFRCWCAWEADEPEN
jgi:hypothetical protein